MGKKSSPPPPDYTAAAEKTAAANQANLTQQTWANRMNQYNPWGSETYSTTKEMDPATGQMVTKWNQNTTLNPELQHALDSQIAMQSGRSDLAASLFPRAQEEFGQKLDYSGLTGWAGPVQSGQLDAITNPYGFGPRQQRIDTSRMGTPDLQTQLDYSGLQGVQGAQQNRSAAENAMYGQATSRLDPQWQKQQSDLENQLVNQGFRKGSTGYQDAMDAFQRQKTDAYNQATFSAINQGGAEAQRNQAMDMALRQQQQGEIGTQGNFYNTALGQMFGFGGQAREQQLAAQQAAYGQGMQGANYNLAQQQQAFGQQQAAGAQNFSQQLQAAQFQNQLRQQQLTEMLQQRGASLNEINAIMSGQQVSSPQFAGYNQAGMVNGPDYMGAAQNQYQAQTDAANRQQAQSGQIMGAIGGIAGSVFGGPIGGAIGSQLGAKMSDRRVKADIKRIGRHARGFGIYRYRFIGEAGPRIGVIAQEVQRVAPELVHDLGGVLAVDYAAL